MKQKNYVRRLAEEETDTEGTWAVSYGDLVTLLLTFFILFFSLDPNASNKQGGEQDKLNPLSLSLLGKLDKFAQPAINEETNTNLSGGNQNSGLSIDQDFIKKSKASVLKSGQRIIIDFPMVSFFKSGKIPLTREGQLVLKNFTDVYSPYMGKYNLVIQAYADSKKVRNNKSLKYSDNLELSALRGIATLRFMEKAGIPIRNMKVAGYGEIETTMLTLGAIPKNKNNPKYLLGLARRVVLVIEPVENKQ